MPNADKQWNSNMQSGKEIVEWFYVGREPRYYTDYAPTLRSERTGLLVMDIKVWDGYNQQIRADSTTTGVLTRNCGADLKRNGQGIIEMDEQIRIRKLTPTECFRLMGFTDEDIKRCQAVGMSNSQLYKQAGNSIVVSVLEAIFGQMFEGKEEEWKKHW